jgi:eukaryotic-like serine/threonine-protein kinase
VIFDSILNRAPTAPVRLNPNLPSELERIINKALEKDRDLRYQVASEMRADLKRLKREVDSGKSAAVNVAQPSPASSLGTVVAPANAPAAAVALGSAVTQLPAVAAPRRKQWYILAVAIAIAAAIIGGYLYRHNTRMLTEKDSIVLADFANTTGEPSSTMPSSKPSVSSWSSLRF